jgi:UDP-N-acetylglucosamine/UDP-N-acetyl-alpha-D-glucosaminouronate 4-epimerase
MTMKNAREVHVVTGGAGFIGSHLVDSLLAEGCRVRVVDDFSTGKESNLSPGVEIVKGDVNAVADRALKDAAVVYHLAAQVSVPSSVASPRSSHRATAESTLAVLEAAERAGVRRFVLASSSAVYGDLPPLPKMEEHSVDPKSPYAVAKYCSELYARYWVARGTVETVALRFFNVYGPRQDPRSPYAAAIPIFVNKLLSGLPVPIYGDGEQTRDFTYVGDVVRGIRAAATAPGANGRVYNIASGRALSVAELVRTIAASLEREARVQILPARPGDIRHSWADVSRARRELYFAAETSLDEGLRRTVDWSRQSGAVAA